MLRRVLIASVVACLLAGAASPAAQGASSPVVSKVAPLDVAIGETLTITGKGFLPGKLKNTVVFQRDNSKPVFVRADDATSTRITLVLPQKLLPFLTQKGGAVGATQFRLRVLSRRLGRSFTKKDISPTVKPPKDAGGSGGGAGSGGAAGAGADGAAKSTPAAPATASAPSPAPSGVAPDPRGPDGDCDHDGVANKDETDADNDGLSDTEEAKWHTDPCNADTDADGVSDFFEVQSAIDLNYRGNQAPTKLPAADPLKPDANVDYDHDGLTLGQEYALWVRYGGSVEPLNYSDGNQNTGGPASIPSGKDYLDLDHNGTLSDDEKDADKDGLGNWVEIHFLDIDWLHTASAVKPDPNAKPLDYLDPDTDGDGIQDGADDQDHDGLSNLTEITSTLSDPLDPCDPNHGSGYCYLHG
jgi:hypothetical protein